MDRVVTMSHSGPGSPKQRANRDQFPDASLQISGIVSTNSRCWHESTDCQLYRATTNRPVNVGSVVSITAGEAKARGYGLCSGCLRRLTGAK
jgi:hypothetical protein